MGADEKRKQAVEAREDEQEDLELGDKDAEEVVAGAETIHEYWKLTPPSGH